MTAVLESWLDQYKTSLGREESLLGVLAVLNHSGYQTLSGGSQLFTLLIVDHPDNVDISQQHVSDNIRIQERRMSRSLFETILREGREAGILLALKQGEIWLDRNGYLQTWKERLNDFPDAYWQRKMLKEFGQFLKCYYQSRDYLYSDQVLDAYSSAVEAIHHWARIVVLEQRVHPEVTVWQQVKRINPGVYKVYEELITSQETLKQRVELVLLACDFSVTSKMKTCSAAILNILEQSAKPLGLQELKDKLGMESVSEFVPLIINKLAKRALIQEVAVTSGDDLSNMELKYTIVR